uniref:Atp8 n=1 Tax=Pterocladiophila hemisphaerica TaxID=2712948 RepID=A0A6M3WWK8_9FLOR|nr:Atp8 [Pterocladiophila hemisphaerica]
MPQLDRIIIFNFVFWFVLFYIFIYTMLYYIILPQLLKSMIIRSKILLNHKKEREDLWNQNINNIKQFYIFFTYKCLVIKTKLATTINSQKNLKKIIVDKQISYSIKNLFIYCNKHLCKSIIFYPKNK